MAQVNLEAIVCIGEKIKKALKCWWRLRTPPECEHDFLRMLMRFLSPDELDLLYEYRGHYQDSYVKWMHQLFISSGVYEEDGDGNVYVIKNRGSTKLLGVGSA